MTIRSGFVLLLSFLSIFYAVAQSQSFLSSEALRQHIEYLASEELKGRRTGMPEALQAANYIRNQLASYGLMLTGQDGFQEFKVITGITLGNNNYLTAGNQNLLPGEDYIPLSFSVNGASSAEMVFIGFGIKYKNDTLEWNDWESSEIKNKWVVVLKGGPDFKGIPEIDPSLFEERYLSMLAQDYGATGIIFVSPANFDPDDQLTKLNYDKNPATATIPVLQIKRLVFDQIIAPLNYSTDQFYDQIATTKKSVTIPLGIVASVNVNLEKTYSTGRNIIAILPGSDGRLKDEYIVIGAHYDHLGMGGHGSGSRIPDTIAVHYGADDNASGVAGILELARKFSLNKNLIGRSLIFIAFDGEELGLTGSRYFINNSPVDLSAIKAMVNFDMIGRLKDNLSLSVAGTGTAIEFNSLLQTIGANHPLQLKLSPDGFGPSDHAVFYAKNIPVLFITTGVHTDYHSPGDHPSKINYDGMIQVLNFASDLIRELSNHSDKFSFVSTGSATRRDHRSNLKVTLGIMPDMTSSENMGLKVDGVRPGAPAYNGGMKAGDIIISIDGQTINNIYDYMGRLKNLKPGQIISVDVLREGKKEVLIIQL